MHLNLTSTLLTVSSNLKDFIHQYNSGKEIFDLQARHDSMELITNKTLFSENYIIGIFSVHYYDNFSTGYNFDNIFIM